MCVWETESETVGEKKEREDGRNGEIWWVM